MTKKIEKVVVYFSNDSHFEPNFLGEIVREHIPYLSQEDFRTSYKGPTSKIYFRKIGIGQDFLSRSAGIVYTVQDLKRKRDHDTFTFELLGVRQITQRELLELRNPPRDPITKYVEITD